MARAICMAESGCQPSAINHNWDGSTDYGEFQINSVHAGMVGGNLSLLFDPETNVRIAAQIFHQQGWRPWTTFQLGAYTKFLN